ncbi:MAG TPA: ATP synthase F1 subunit gamma [Bacteroidetes bacterium]|nr:ATP synthase F1 subunit gamma [Bacteroidota bacterium]
MQTLKEIRTRIKSVSSTRQITAAMKMVAAAKLRKAQDAILRLRPYASAMHHILLNVTVGAEKNGNKIFTENREPENILIVLVTANRGLCGAFNANVIKHVRMLTEEKYTQQLGNKQVHFICIGKKGYDFLRLRQYPVLAHDQELGEKPRFEEAAKLADELKTWFIEKKYDRIYLVYNQFKNAAVQMPVAEMFLPLRMEKKPSGWQRPADYIMEPSRDVLLEELIPRSLRIQLFKALTDSYAAEQGARMTAMHQATDNATELLRELQLTYNKARQAAITKELSEIVGGADAL